MSTNEVYAFLPASLGNSLIIGTTMAKRIRMLVIVINVLGFKLGFWGCLMCKKRSYAKRDTRYDDADMTDADKIVLRVSITQFCAIDWDRACAAWIGSTVCAERRSKIPNVA